jgi:hypothetical protein
MEGTCPEILPTCKPIRLPHSPRLQRLGAREHCDPPGHLLPADPQGCTRRLPGAVARRPGQAGKSGELSNEGDRQYIDLVLYEQVTPVLDYG